MEKLRQVWENITIFARRERVPLYVGAGVICVAFVAGTTFAYFQHRNKTVSCTGDLCVTTTATDTPSSDGTTQPTPTPNLVPSHLTGLLVPEGTEALTPLAVMIENHPDARPQSGLSSADLVYEAIAEGGITRFMAVYGNPATPVRVGPIRSARTYFVDFATELGAFYAHVGGNADALDQIKATGVKDLDEFAVGSPTYQRDTSRNVAIEHTMYSSTEKLWAVATQTKKLSTVATYGAWKFADDPAVADRPQAQKVTINFSSASYAVSWVYDPLTNTYTRYLANQPHIDANNNTAITAKNIILETVQHKPTVTRINEDGQIFTLTGSGKGVLIHNGTATPVTWKKSGTERTRYYDANNNEVTLTSGKTWVEIVHPETAVTY